MNRHRLDPAIQQTCAGFHNQKPFTASPPETIDQRLILKEDTTGGIGDTMRLIHRPLINNDNITQQALDSPSNQPGKRSGQQFV